MRRVGCDRRRREGFAGALCAQHAHRVQHDRARMKRRFDEIGHRNDAETAREIHLHACGIAGDAAGVPDRAIALGVKDRKTQPVLTVKLGSLVENGVSEPAGLPLR